MSRFFCDSNCELWYAVQESLGINYISMPYTVEHEEYYYDLGKNTDSKAFFDKMRKGAVPKTSALNKQNYLDYFEPVFASGEDIFYLTFSQKMSGTFGSMNLAIEELKEKYPERKITVVDSKNISMGAGILVYLTALKHNEGASDSELEEYAIQMREKIKCYFTVGDLVYLKRGGRLSSFEAFMGGILNIKPIISPVDGKLESIMKVNGRKKSLKTLFDILERDGVDLTKPISIINADCEEDANFLLSMVKEKFPSADVWVQQVGPVIGSHCGPDTVGLIFVKK